MLASRYAMRSDRIPGNSGITSFAHTQFSDLNSIGHFFFCFCAFTLWCRSLLLHAHCDTVFPTVEGSYIMLQQKRIFRRLASSA